MRSPVPEKGWIRFVMATPSLSTTMIPRGERRGSIALVLLVAVLLVVAAAGLMMVGRNEAGCEP